MVAGSDVTWRKQMLVEPGGKKWFENEVGWNHVVANDGGGLAGNDELEGRATRILQHDLELYKKYQNFKENRSNFGWIGTVLRTGTVADKMAAHTILIQDSAVHNLGSVESLVKMIDPRGKRECLMAADSLKDVFLADLLPPDRKLRPFGGHPFASLGAISEGRKDSEDAVLMLWHFESRLKQLFISFVGALSKMAQDPLVATKKKAISIMHQLLAGHPEQEQMLLRNLVNKVGDPDRKTASQVSLYLGKLVDRHPRMKAVVVGEVERLLFRPNVSEKACYYAVCFLNQLILDKEDCNLASKLITMYIALFKAAVKRGEVESKMMSALLTGVNRAFPFADGNPEKVGEQMDALYKTVHKNTFNVSVQALTLLFHVLSSQSHFNDRFYCALYRKLIDPCFKNMSKPAMFLNLLYKTMKNDDMERRVYAFIKRILQIVPEQIPPVMCGLLFVVSEVLKGRSRKLLTKSKEIELDDGEEVVSDDDDKEDRLDSETAGKVVETSDRLRSRVAGDSWVHRTNDRTDSSKSSTASPYDPFHRNPLFAKAQYSSAVELLKLSRHYHPTVALFARTVLDGNTIVYSGDPLQDFTLIRFLDRFVFRNPKKPNVSNELSQRNILGKRKFYVPLGVRAVPVNQGDFIRTEKKVPVDEQFFYNYFIAKRKASKVVNEYGDDEDDIMSVASDEFEAALDAFEPNALEDRLDVDFANDVKSGTSKKAAKKTGEQEFESDEDDDHIFDDEFQGSFKEFERDVNEAKNGVLEIGDGYEDEFADDDFEDLGDDSKKGSKRKGVEKNKNKKERDFSDDDDDDCFDFDVSKLKKNKPNSKRDFGAMDKYFVSADEFSSILEENATSGMDTISLEAMVNRDNSNAKQLRWEQDRDRFVRGVDWKTKKRRMGVKNRVSKGNKKRSKGRGSATKTGKSKRR